MRDKKHVRARKRNRNREQDIEAERKKEHTLSEIWVEEEKYILYYYY